MYSNMTSSNPEQSKEVTAWLDAHDLSNREKVFVVEYLRTLNQTEAARRAGSPNASAHVWGSRTVRKAKVSAAIADGLTRLTDDAVIEVTELVRKLWAIANSSPADITKLHHGACRYCHGADHLYQWKTEREFFVEFRKTLETEMPGARKAAARRETALKLRTMPAGERSMLEVDPFLPDDLGGYGYCITRNPDPDCPECAGLGITYIRFVETDALDEAGRLLFEGVKETRTGFKVKFADRTAAMDKLAKYLRLYSSNEDGAEDPLEALGRQIMEMAEAVPVRP